MTAEVETLAQDEELLECSSLYPEKVRNIYGSRLSIKRQQCSMVGTVVN